MRDERREPRNAVEQVVRGEHRRIGGQFVDVARAFEQPDERDALREAFTALCEQLDVHFEQEERLYYASIGALRPDVAPEIRAISSAHAHFRLQLAAIADQLRRGEIRAAHQGFSTLAADFHQHEALEEKLLQRIDPKRDSTP